MRHVLLLQKYHSTHTLHSVIVLEQNKNINIDLLRHLLSVIIMICIDIHRQISVRNVNFNNLLDKILLFQMTISIFQMIFIVFFKLFISLYSISENIFIYFERKIMFKLNYSVVIELIFLTKCLKW